MSLLPIFLKLDNRPGLLVGAGAVALDKAGSLLQTGLRLRVIAPQAHEEIRRLASQGQLEYIERAFEPNDLDGNFLVIAATNDPAVNAAVYQGALQRNILCNSVDDIPNCDFFFGSVVRRGGLQIAISTAGESPAFAQRLRREIDAQLPADLGPWLAEVGELRREVLATHPCSETRKLLLHELAQRQICDSPTCSTRQLTRTAHAAHSHESVILSDRSAAQGVEGPAVVFAQLTSFRKVHLVGAGPGDPDLLTVKALRLIQSAQVILHDDLVPPAILALAAPTAIVVNVGKRCGTKSITQEEIHALMIEHAHAGRGVVRLKSGDPLLFGRAAEEMAALTAAEIPFEVVPGVSAAFAAAAAVGASLTSRDSASSVVLSTGHHAQSHDHAAVPERESATRVVYMPGRDLRLLALEWLSEGLPADFPCALVARAGQPDQQIVHTTLGELHNVGPVPAPSLLLAGWALRTAHEAAASPAHASSLTV
ncbi:MAG TPA: siroheme synthase CysG [Terracidiphilus sp.]|jgi:uroporphyrin-III C-methyltransferase/precorrin-2 dehydrogenase/sirohydrochlorin ferrochelatase|nr:siroheme synthase CysG [Terracidiphilus sp.]